MFRKFSCGIVAASISLVASLALAGEADLLLVNGKIVTMEDYGVNTNTGRTVQAMAIRGDKIMALGTNDEMLRFAGPQTKKLDVKGRAVFPGFIDTHNHLHDGAVGRWARNNPAKVDKIAKNFNVQGKNYACVFMIPLSRCPATVFPVVKFR